MGQHVAYNKDLDCSRLYVRCVGQLITAQRTLVCPPYGLTCHCFDQNSNKGPTLQIDVNILRDLASRCKFVNVEHRRLY